MGLLPWQNQSYKCGFWRLSGSRFKGCVVCSKSPELNVATAFQKSPTHHPGVLLTTDLFLMTVRKVLENMSSSSPEEGKGKGGSHESWCSDVTWPDLNLVSGEAPVPFWTLLCVTVQPRSLAETAHPECHFPNQMSQACTHMRDSTFLLFSVSRGCQTRESVEMSLIRSLHHASIVSSSCVSRCCLYSFVTMTDSDIDMVAEWFPHVVPGLV